MTRFLPSLLPLLLVVLPYAISCSSSDDAVKGTDDSTTTPLGLDGTWDILAAGDVSLAASEMTINAGKVKGTVVLEREGSTRNGCKLTKDRAEIDLNVAGNALSGSITTVTEYDGDDCPSNEREITEVNGSRASATAGSGLTGSWELHIGDEDNAVVVDIDGAVAKAWERKKDKADGDEPEATGTIAGDSLTVTSDDDDFSFSARRR